MATMKERIIAGTGAFFFFLSVIGVTVVVLISLRQESTRQQTAQTDPAACSANGTYEQLPEPEAFRPEGDVTELQFTDLQSGNGAEAKTGQCLIVKYFGTLASDGKKFDGNFTETTAFAFTLGQGNVIQGWDQGLAGLKEGGTRRLVIPSNLAYGEQGQGQIPANADLVFVVKLLEIKE